MASLWASYSYSESIAPYYGTTGNAASTGNSWNMQNVLPTPPGLDINGVIYNYTIQKEVDDSVDVHVQNKNIAGTGYIFRETDQWKPGSLGGTEIRKVVPVVPGLNRELWGDGSIEVDGPGSVEDPNVVYMYKVDPCYNPQFDPNCPGYEVPMPVIPDIEIYDATQDEYVNLNDDEKSLIEENEETVEEELEEDEEEEEKRKREYRLAMLADTNAAGLFAENQRIIIMNGIMQKQIDNGYTNKIINGGVYKETVTLIDKTLEDNQQGLRNGLAQQLLHNQMVDMQYNN